MNKMKTERPRWKCATKPRLLYSLESKLRTLPNLLKFEGNLTPWQMVPRLLLLLLLPPGPHRTLTLPLLVVKAKTTGLK